MNYTFKKLFLLLLICYGVAVQAQDAGNNLFPPGANPDRVVLNVTQDPSTSIAVNWRTIDSVQQGFIEILQVTADPRKISEALKTPAVSTAFTLEKQSATYHSATISNLLPNTAYMYRVGSGNHWSEWFHTTTAGKAGEKFSFIYMGDVQAGIKTLWPRVIRQAFVKCPDARLIMYAGDIVNRGNNDDEWGELFYGGSFIHSMIPGMPSPGNHEYAKTDDTLSAQWRKQFTLPLNGPEGLEETAYYTDVQGVRFISINSYRVEESDVDLKKQQEWVEGLLKNNPNKWTCVTFHHPFYSIRPTRDNMRMRNTFKPLFDKYKVDIVLQGHDHAYARGMQKIAGPTSASDNGTVYVLSVSGSKMSSTFESKWSDVSATYTQLYQVISIDNNILNYESYTAEGKLYDHFQLLKQKGQKNKLVEKLKK